MTEKMIRKDLRSQFNPVGWPLLVYFVIMNMVAIGFELAIVAVKLIGISFSGNISEMNNMDSVLDMTVLSWAYVITVAVGMIVLLLWKKPAYFRNEIFARGKAMTGGAFFGILCVFLGVQLVTVILNTIIELILNMMGLSMMVAMENAAGLGDAGIAMFLYAAILAPITEEILFRGLVQRTLMPHGKKFAIFCSALMFGIYHGNLAQTPFAFMTGLVLGYVAAEYNIVWAMVLHMINNLVLSDMLGRLTSSLPYVLSSFIELAVIIAFGIAGIVVLIVNHRKIGEYLRQERMNRLCLQAFFSHPGVIILFVLTFLNGLLLFTAI